MTGALTRPDVEAALLGCALHGAPLPDGVGPALFTEPRHRAVLDVLRALHDRGEAVGITAVYRAIEATAPDWDPIYVAEIAHAPGATTGNPLAPHLLADALRATAHRRWLHSIGATLTHAALDGDLDPCAVAAMARAALTRRSADDAPNPHEVIA